MVWRHSLSAERIFSGEVVMGSQRCVACGERFTPCRHIPNQRYCAKPACQRARRRRWQREQLKQDADYRANQAAAQRRWRERHPDYWRKYRQTHPDYSVRNREQLINSGSMEGRPVWL